MRVDVEKRQQELLNFLSGQMTRLRAAIEAKKPNFIDNIENAELQRSVFISGFRRIPLACQSFFVVLRKWNSYTPSLPVLNNTSGTVSEHSIGGGYFLYIESQDPLKKGYGLVIDPGYNFLHNFGMAGFCLDDIDGVFITHAHNDHTNDFESILSLLYQRNDKFKGRKYPKKIDLFLNVGAFKKFSNYLDLSKNDARSYIGNVIVMSPGQAYDIPGQNLDCKMFTLFTRHNEIITTDYSLGVCFKLSGRNILLTGDTGWSEDVAQKNEELLRRYGVFTREERESESDNIDVLVAHIGSIKRQEFDIKPSQENPDKYYYKNHLGVLGVITAVERWKPDLCIISEFGEELTDLRETVSREIQQTCAVFRETISCIPGDVGFCILLDQREGLCYFSKKFISWDELAYRDVIDSDHGQKTIKYFSNLYSGCDQVALSALPIRNTVSFVREKTLEQIAESFDLVDITMEGLIRNISEANYNYECPDEADEVDYCLLGTLLALSCIIDDPVCVIYPSSTCNRIDLIKDYLDTYSYDTKLFEQFWHACAGMGILGPEPEHPEYDIVFRANKANIEKFLQEYSSNNISAATSTLGAIGSESPQSYWDNLTEVEKIELILEYDGRVEGLALNFLFSNFAQYVYKIREALVPPERLLEYNRKIVLFLARDTESGIDETGQEADVLTNIYELLKQKDSGNVSAENLLNELNCLLNL